MFAVPTSPLVLNFTPSLVAVITTAAAGNSIENSRQVSRWQLAARYNKA
jgi:hypothetical protein